MLTPLLTSPVQTSHLWETQQRGRKLANSEKHLVNNSISASFFFFLSIMLLILTGSGNSIEGPAGDHLWAMDKDHMFVPPGKPPVFVSQPNTISYLSE